MKIYIIGGITGVEDYKSHFKNAQVTLEAQGYDVINPAIVVLPKSCTWGDYMKVTLAMLTLADGIYMLKDWKNSKGACVEYGYATAADMVILKQ